MSGTNDDCDLNKLIKTFCSTQSDYQAVIAIDRLYTYVQQRNMLLCVMSVKTMQDYVRYLYSLEDADFTPDDSARELRIVSLFYDYLISRECLVVNPLRELKALAVRQLVDAMEGRGKNNG